MITIRIIETFKNKAEIIVTDSMSNLYPPLEKKRLVSNKLLNKFFIEWKASYLQSQQLKNHSPNDKSIDNEILQNLKKKGKEGSIKQRADSKKLY